MEAADRPRVFLDVTITGEPAGRLIVELFPENAPNTCEKFRRLCVGDEGLSYAQTPFHRVVDEFMIQGGDVENGDGTGIADAHIHDDENAATWREMDATGLVCSAARARDPSGSQFFITLVPCPHLNGKHTIFGRVVQGQDTLLRVSKVTVDKDDRPLEPVLVSRCGELETRRKKGGETWENARQAHSRDRGRRRRSGHSDAEMEASFHPKRAPGHRRQSDNVVDEGLRGRPRQRSGIRSLSQALLSESSGDGNDEEAPATIHKRKRSPAQGPHAHRTDDQGYCERRRKSLPNQYADNRFRDYREDEERYRPSPRHSRDWYQGDKTGEGWRSAKAKDQHRPDRRARDSDDGRLGGEGFPGEYGGEEPGIKFKGRGVMKYREPGRL